MDITEEGNPVEITFVLQRYMCKDCAEQNKESRSNGVRTTFTANCLPTCIRNRKQISTDMIDAIVKKVAGKHMSISDAADSMHVSAASISSIISKYRKAALNRVVTLEPTDTLIVYPFDYGDSERCAILGVINRRPMLYTILQDCTDESVHKYLTKTSFCWDCEPFVSLTDYPRPKLHKLLTILYKNCDIGILRESTLKKMKALRDQSWNVSDSAELDFVLEELGRVLTLHFYDYANEEYVPVDLQDKDFYEFLSENDIDLEKETRESFNAMLQLWWEDVSPKMREHLQDIYDGLVANEEQVRIGLEYNESLYSPWYYCSP